MYALGLVVMVLPEVVEEICDAFIVLHHCGVVDADGHGDQAEHHGEEAVPLNQLHGIPYWVAESTSVSCLL